MAIIILIQFLFIYKLGFLPLDSSLAFTIRFLREALGMAHKSGVFSLWASKGAKCFLQGINSSLLLLQSFINYLLCKGETIVHSSFCFSQSLTPRLVPDFHNCL